MTLKQFYEQTKDLDPDTLIVLSSDSEGNQFKKSQELSLNLSYYDGEIFGQDDLDEDSGEDIMDYARKCVVIWPV